LVFEPNQLFIFYGKINAKSLTKAQEKPKIAYATSKK